MSGSAGTQFPLGCPDVVARTVAGETLLVPVRGGVAECDHVFILNATGSFLWPLLDGTRGVNVLAGEVAEAFAGVEPTAARTDVESFLAALEARQLVRWVAP